MKMDSDSDDNFFSLKKVKAKTFKASRPTADMGLKKEEDARKETSVQNTPSNKKSKHLRGSSGKDSKKSY
jgi:hypothetical protein